MLSVISQLLLAGLLGKSGGPALKPAAEENKPESEDAVQKEIFAMESVKTGKSARKLNAL